METFHHHINTFSRNISSFFDEKFREFALATSYVELLLLVREKDSQSQKEISEAMNLAPSTITRFISKLEKKELVNKKRNAREIVVTLSPEGKQLASHLADQYRKAGEELEGILGRKYVETTGKLLKHGVELMQ